MTNSFTNTDKVAAESLRLLMNNLSFCKLINQKYSKNFKAPESIGDTLRIRVPFNPKVRVGKTADPQDFVEQNRSLTIDQQRGVDVKFSSLEKELDIKEFSDRVLRNEMSNLSADIESKNLGDLVPLISNAITNSTLSSRDIYKTKARLSENLTPMDARLTFLINPTNQVDLLEGTEKFFNSSKQIDSQYEDGSMGKFSGFNFRESNLIPNYDTGTSTDRVGAVKVTASEGDSVLSLEGFTISGTILKGEIFTIAGVKDLNYQTKRLYARDKQFVVLADSTADGAGDISVTVAPVYAGGGTVGGSSTDTLKNVSKLPTAADVVTLLGAADSSYAQSIAFHPDFATIAFCDPKVPRGVNEGSKHMEDGVGMRYVEDFDIVNDDYLSRFDTYFGNTELWQVWACRVIEIP